MRFAQAFDPLRSLQATWRLMTRAPAMFFVGGLLLGFLGGEAGDGPGLLLLLAAPAQALARVLGGVPYWLLLAPLTLGLWAALFAFGCWLQVGFARAIALGLRTGEDELALVFGGGDRFVAMVLARLLSGAALVASALPLAAVVTGFVLTAGEEGHSLILWLALLAFTLVWGVAFLYVCLGLFLVRPIVALEDAGPLQSIARSWELARGQRLRLLGFEVLLLLLAIAGVLTCFLGQLLTNPLIEVLRLEVYVALANGEHYPQWWIGGGGLASDGQDPEEVSSAAPQSR